MFYDGIQLDPRPLACSRNRGSFAIFRMKQIRLTRGLFALVDDDVFEWASKFKWFAHWRGSAFYAARTEYSPNGGKCKTISLHREILSAAVGTLVDHKDRDTMNCRRENLRFADRAGSARNRSPFKGRKFKGVFFRKDKLRWRAGIGVNWKMIWLGHFDSDIEAAKAYDIAARKHFGKFAVLNFPN